MTPQEFKLLIESLPTHQYNAFKDTAVVINQNIAHFVKRTMVILVSWLLLTVTSLIWSADYGINHFIVTGLICCGVTFYGRKLIVKYATLMSITHMISVIFMLRGFGISDELIKTMFKHTVPFRPRDQAYLLAAEQSAFQYVDNLYQIK